MTDQRFIHEDKEQPPVEPDRFSTAAFFLMGAALTLIVTLGVVSVRELTLAEEASIRSRNNREATARTLSTGRKLSADKAH